jgi:hypothetical protein
MFVIQYWDKWIPEAHSSTSLTKSAGSRTMGENLLTNKQTNKADGWFPRNKGPGWLLASTKMWLCVYANRKACICTHTCMHTQSHVLTHTYKTKKLCHFLESEWMVMGDNCIKWIILLSESLLIFSHFCLLNFIQIHKIINIYIMTQKYKWNQGNYGRVRGEGEKRGVWGTFKLHYILI